MKYTCSLPSQPIKLTSEHVFEPWRLQAWIVVTGTVPEHLMRTTRRCMTWPSTDSRTYTSTPHLGSRASSHVAVTQSDQHTFLRRDVHLSSKVLVSRFCLGSAKRGPSATPQRWAHTEAYDAFLRPQPHDPFCRNRMEEMNKSERKTFSKQDL